MSASNQKKLRKEKAAAYMTERQRIEAQEKKKLKAYTTTFWIVLALCVCIVVGTVVSNPIKNVVYSNADAVTIGNHTLSAVQLNYFYIDAVNNYVSQYQNYISYIMNTSKPLDEQVADKETGATWADTFLDSAFESIKSTYGIYDIAMEKGHKLSEEEQKSIDTVFANLELYAQVYGYSSVDAYLRAVYGNGATAESYKEYYTVSAIADSYYTAYSDSLEYEADALRAYEKDKMYEYNSYTFASYYVNAAKFREGGTKNDKGEIVYTEEEKKAAIEKAEAAANALAKGEYKDLEAFNKAISEMEINKDVESAKATEYTDVLYSSVNALFKDWVIGKVVTEKDEKAGDSTEDKKDDEKDEEEVTYEERKEGDMKVIVSESGTGDSKTINGYYVLRYESVEKNEFLLRNVRHILVQFEGGKYNSTTGETTYTDAEKKKAQKDAQALLEQWKAGAKTEDSFADLATKETDDSGSKNTGGLYEDIYPGQMVEPFANWVYAEERKAGDTGIVETAYGYHIMYYVGESEINYRDFMITNAIRSEDLTKWHEDLVKAAKLVELTRKYVKTDLILSQM